MKILSTLLGALLLITPLHGLQDVKEAKTKKIASAADAALIAKQLPSYPVKTCLVSNEPLDAMGAPINIVYEGRLVRFCCKGCVKEFKKEPKGVVAKIDAAVIEQQVPSYPLKTCVISGEELGSMGDPIDMVHGTRLVRLCCKGCVKGFKKNAAKNMAMVDAALIAEQKKTYPLTTCLVAGNEIEGDGVDVLYGTRLVRFCCPDCAEKFAADPEPYVAKVKAQKKAMKKAQKKGTKKQG